MSVTHPDQIYKTQHVDVISEPTNPDGSQTSSSTAVTIAAHEIPPTTKSKSLMGTTVMGGRATRLSRPDPEGRGHSPSESEKQIFRKSTDSEREGTKWIEGGD